MKSCILSWLIGLVASMSLATGGPAETAGGATPSAAADHTMIAVLAADGPHVSLGEHNKIMSRLVGRWAVEYMDISKDGKAVHRTGELLVGWILDGRAIQDVWIVDPSGSRKDREGYTDIRYFDPKSGSWPATFVDPEHASVARFTGGSVGENSLVLETDDLGAVKHRWSFEDIERQSFVFRDEASSEDGKSWQLKSEYHMRRLLNAAPGVL